VLITRLLFILFKYHFNAVKFSISNEVKFIISHDMNAKRPAIVADLLNHLSKT